MLLLVGDIILVSKASLEFSMIIAIIFSDFVCEKYEMWAFHILSRFQYTGRIRNWSTPIVTNTWEF